MSPESKVSPSPSVHSSVLRLNELSGCGLKVFHCVSFCCKTILELFILLWIEQISISNLDDEMKVSLREFVIINHLISYFKSWVSGGQTKTFTRFLLHTFIIKQFHNFPITQIRNSSISYCNFYRFSLNFTFTFTFTFTFITGLSLTFTMTVTFSLFFTLPFIFKDYW